MRPSAIDQPQDDYKAQILNEILLFWENIPKSSLQELARKAERKEAIKRWEKDAKDFYHRFSPHPPDSEFRVVWNDQYWKIYRSVLVVDRSGTAFLYPQKYFQLQGITKSFYDLFLKRWEAESNKSLEKFLEITWILQKEVMADLNDDERACLQSACRSIENPDTQAMNWAAPKYYAKETGISPNRLTRVLQRLHGYGIIATTTYVNFARIGLKPYIFISKRDIEELELDYCFFQVKSVETETKFSGIAVPPVAIKMGWHSDAKGEGTLEPITSFCIGWNLSRLSEEGWGDVPSFHMPPEKTAFGQLRLDFKTTPIRLRPSDPIYLERVQPVSSHVLRAEFGVSAQQRLRDLGYRDVIQPSPAFKFIQCGAMIFLYCRGASAVLETIAALAPHFPRFRNLIGENWILMTLDLPPSWVFPSLIALKTFVSHLSVEDLLIDVHQGAAVRYLPFSKLWHKESKEWIA
ncbi:MAG: hypothetical protein JSV05_05230 [Candidatus Bathyarchaeota archaeon]|nr:MAG: hypothetical protein JSV05_05230 [Candidatus Bathyarchaeota archaeon]